MRVPEILPDDTVCACLHETGERKVRVYDRCERCHAFMESDAADEIAALVSQVETLREALRELVDSHDALEGETISFELQHATVDRFEAAMAAARAALEGAKS